MICLTCTFCMSAELIASYKVLAQRAECSVFDSPPEAADFYLEKRLPQVSCSVLCCLALFGYLNVCCSRSPVCAPYY